MKFTIERSHALAALSSVIGAVPSRSPIPVLNNIRIYAHTDDGVEFRGTDLDMESVALTLADVEREGMVTIDAAKFREIVNAAAPGSDLSLELNGDDPRVQIKSGRSRFKLPVLSADDYPAMPVHDGARFTIGSHELKALIEYVAFAMSDNEIMYVLNGVYFYAHSGNLRAVATNTHKLAYRDGPAVETFDPVIIPRKAVGELQRALNGYAGDVVVVIGSAVSFSMGAHTITTKRIDGTFPDYQRILPRDNPLEIVADAELLSAAIKRAVIAADDRASAVVLSASDGVVSVFRKGETEARDEFDAAYSGDDIEIGFNAKYLLDTLARISGDVSIRLRDSASPSVWRAAGDDMGLAVVMPLRV